MTGIILLLILICLYFLPSYLASEKKNFVAIFTLNLLLGWLLIPWVIALVWALMKE